MSKLIIGFILGLVVSAVGFSGIARMFDKGVQTIQTQSKELAQWFGQIKSKLLQKWLTKIYSFAIILICWAVMQNIF